jgi:cytochrome c-type biogenesis protein CcmH/NrfF
VTEQLVAAIAAELAELPGGVLLWIGPGAVVTVAGVVIAVVRARRRRR